MPATNCTANTSRQSLYAFSTAGSTTLSKQVACRSFGLKSDTTYAKDDGANGTLWSRDEDYVVDKTSVGGTVDMAVRPSDLRWILPLITGGTFSGNDIKPAPSCPFFRSGRYDRKLDKVFTYVDCVTSRAVLSSNDGSNGLLGLSWDILCSQRTRGAAGTWPVGLTLATQQPFVHRQSVVTIDGTAKRVKNSSIAFDNQLMTDEFYNSQYRGDFPQDGQLITFSHESPFDDSSDENLLDLVTSVSASVVYTSGALSLTFTFPALRAIPSEPGIGGRGTRVTNSITWEAAVKSSGSPSDAPVLITLDDTP